MRARRLPEVDIPADILAECEERKRQAMRRMKPFDQMPKWAREQKRHDQGNVLR